MRMAKKSKMKKRQRRRIKKTQAKDQYLILQTLEKMVWIIV
jgi:hypothetical protein